MCGGHGPLHCRFVPENHPSYRECKLLPAIYSCRVFFAKIRFGQTGHIVT